MPTLVHFWSLAIEEQFYLLFPIAVLVVRRLSPSRAAFRSRLRAMLLLGLTLSALTSLIAGAVGATDFVYYSLPTRGGEIIVGALLATSMSASRLIGQRRSRWPVVCGTAALGGIALLVATTTSTTSWVTDGGLTVFALLSAVLVVSALPIGPFATALAVPPLRWLGRISYGVYLYHWPIILWLTPDRVGLTGWPLVGIQAAVTLSAAGVSYQLLELPIRRGRVVKGQRARLAVPVALVLASALTVWATASFTQPPLIDFARSAAALHTAGGHAASPTNAQRGPSRQKAHVVDPPTVEVLGDSTGLGTAVGLTGWGEDTARMRVLGWSADGNRWLGCGIIQVGLVRYDGMVSAADHSCPNRNAEWAQTLAVARPNAVVLQFGPFDAADHLLPGDDTWRGPGDPKYDEQLFGAMTALADISLQRGIPTVWLTSPRIDLSHADVPPGTNLPEGDPARMDRINELLRMLASEHPGLHLLNLAAWVKAWPGGEYDPKLRPDGVHFSDGSSRTVANWLGPAILAVLKQPAATSPIR